jgi:hypothetical protein
MVGVLEKQLLGDECNNYTKQSCTGRACRVVWRSFCVLYTLDE